MSPAGDGVRGRHLYGEAPIGRRLLDDAQVPLEAQLHIHRVLLAQRLAAIAPEPQHCIRGVRRPGGMQLRFSFPVDRGAGLCSFRAPVRFVGGCSALWLANENRKGCRATVAEFYSSGEVMPRHSSSGHN